MWRYVVKTFLVCISLTVAAHSVAQAQIEPTWFSSMEARSIGPAGMSGRVAAVDAVVSDPNIIYVGAATGGVWKSVDGGITWKPIFDDQGTGSIGAIAINQANPDIVWVGTGEGNPRNSAGVGDGVYKTMDGGHTWTHLGLERSERIHRIALDPTNPDVAYLGVMGPAWSDGDERGVFKTTDGGHTWDRVLFANERTGASDLVMDPSNPNKLFAAMWEHRRWPWFFESGGEGSGLHVTYDGGTTWKKYTSEDGMPEGNLGRMGLAIAHNDPRVVYALIEAKQSELLRSDDGGITWRTISDEPGVAPRPFYYADIRVDPQNENRLYSLHSRITVSEDQGRTFRTVVPSQKIHGDVQELWINPNDPRFLIMGNDGGIGISYDRGAAWRFVSNLALAQFYHINVDMDIPFNVYGGLQDNGSWFGPSHVWHSGGIRNYDWTRVGGGDGFATFNDFGDSRYGYTQSQQGNLRRFDKVSGERKDIRPVHPDGTRLRFNWNAGFNIDPFDSSTIYIGSQFLHRSRDRGESWEIISPDLTTNDPDKQRSFESGGLTLDASGAENHTAIMTIAPSPVERGVIWVGTDDGSVQVTRDAGATWTNIVDRISDVPEATWVAHIEPSKFEGSTAFVVLDDHRRGNWTTYVFRTNDYGRNWKSLATDEIRGFAHVIEQDPVEPDLLFLGTEFGMYVSLNAGGTWVKWTHGLPTAPFRALMVHGRDHDLVAGTHGRGVYIIDDIRPLRELASDPEIADRALHAFEIPPAYQVTMAEPLGFRSTGDAMFFGENRPYGALISYWSQGSEDSVTVEIADAAGEVIRQLKGTNTHGVNRLAWDLRLERFRRPTLGGGFGGGGGPLVLPGTYNVRIKNGDTEATTTVEVRPDPRTTILDAERRAKFAAIVTTGEQMVVAADLLDRIRDTRETLETIGDALRDRDDEESTALAARGDEIAEMLQAISDRVARASGGGLANTGDLVGSRLNSVHGSLQSSWDAPTQSQRISMELAQRDLQAVVADYNALLSGALAAFKRDADAVGLQLLGEMEPLVVSRE